MIHWQSATAFNVHVVSDAAEKMLFGIEAVVLRPPSPPTISLLVCLGKSTSIQCIWPRPADWEESTGFLSTAEASSRGEDGGSRPDLKFINITTTTSVVCVHLNCVLAARETSKLVRFVTNEMVLESRISAFIAKV